MTFCGFIFKFYQAGFIQMKLSRIIIRTFAGALFTGLGYFLTYRYFSHLTLFGVPHLLPTLVAFVLGAFSIFSLPVLGNNLLGWFKSVLRAIVKESLAEFLGTQMEKIKGRSSHSKPGRSEGGAQEGSELPVGGAVLDTSAIIDGRILDIVRAGFLRGRIVLPRLVLEELRRVADSQNDLRRKRGRRGLEVLEELKKLKGEEFVVWEGELGEGDVDSQLVSLAEKETASLVTVDFNLNKAARVAGVSVLNINDLANALKAILVPGETTKIKLVQPGKEDGQGVGYLEDGTMVVVEDGGEKLGKKVEVEVTRSLQTEAGRMIFARLV